MTEAERKVKAKYPDAYISIGYFRDFTVLEFPFAVKPDPKHPNTYLVPELLSASFKNDSQAAWEDAARRLEDIRE